MQRRLHKCDWRGSYFGGLREMKRRNPSHREEEEEDSEDSDNPEAETWYYEAELVAQNSEAWEQPLYTEPVLKLTSQKGYRSDMRLLPSNTTENIQFLEAVFSTVRNIYGRQPVDLTKDLCEFDYLEKVHEYHSSSSGSSRKRLWHVFLDL